MRFAVPAAVPASLALFLGGSILFAQAAPPAAAPPSSLPTSEALFARALALHRAGDILGAIDNYEAVLAREPGRMEALSNLGAAFAQLGRYSEAIERYQQALEKQPDQQQIRFNLALAFYKEARIPEAAAELERVVAGDPKNLRAVLVLADCRAQLGQDAGVIELLGPREADFKDDRLFAYLLGSALIRNNEILRGQAFIDRLFRDGDTAEAHLLLGAAHVARGDQRAAIPELEKAIALNPALPGAHSLLGRALMNAGRRDDAVKAFVAEIATNRNDFEANLYLGMMLKDEGKLDEAYEHLKRAQRLRSRDVATAYALGALHLAAGRTEEARESLLVVTKEAPEYRQGHVLLATAYYRLKDKDNGDREQALAERLRAAEQAKEPGAGENLGEAYRGQAPPAGTTPDPTAALPAPKTPQ